MWVFFMEDISVALTRRRNRLPHGHDVVRTDS